jgi:alginate O-acetyltransferase complex protein AlgJ
MKTKAAVLSIGHLLFPGAFLVVCLLPWLDFFLHVDPTSSLQENRELAAFPQLQRGVSAINGFPERVNEWFDDNFGFRRLMIQAYGRILLQVFQTPANPAVILGKDNWLFLGGNYGLEYFQSRTLFSPAELARWKSTLQQDRDILRSRNARFLIVIAPNKDTIYPEYLPDNVLKFRPQSRLDQLLEYLGTDPDMEILDLRPALIQAKGDALLYDRSDTHWNGNGALLAYQAILARAKTWFPRLEPLSMDHFTVQSKTDAGDLIAFLGLGGGLADEIIDVVPNSPSQAKEAAYELPSSDKPAPAQYFLPDVWQIDDPELPRVVVFHDSFGNRLMPLLSLNFQRTAFFQTEYYSGYERPMDILNRENPDLVIYEFVERSLQFPGYGFRIERQ